MELNDKSHLVLLPGTLCNEKLWNHQLENLSDIADITVGDLSKDYTIEGMAKSVLNDAPDTFALAGLSLGGMVAIEIMRQAPERISRLALLDTNPNLPKAEQIKMWKHFIEMSKNGEFKAVTENYLLQGLLRPGNKDEKLISLITSMADDIGPVAMERQMMALTNRPDTLKVLPSINCPTTVIVGEEDTTCPVYMSEEIASMIPHANLIIIEDAGHLSSLERPEEVTSELREWFQKDK